MDEYEATAYAAEINLQLWKAEQARRESAEAEILNLSSSLEVVRRLILAAEQLEMHQLREHINRIGVAAGLATRVK